MKRTCKQCGKEFELTEGEVQFYESKGLNLPKRCKECREVNKEQKSEKRETLVTEKRGSEAGWSLKKTITTGIAAMIIVVGALFGGFQIAGYQPGDLNTSNNTSVVAPANNSTNANSNTGASSNASISNNSANTSASTANASSNSNKTNTANTSTSASSNLKFRSKSLLNEHYEKHGKDMGFKSAEEYQAAAAAVATNPAALHKTEKEDGDDVYYLEDTNDFVIVSTDGYLRTYFRPDNGKAYYNKQ